MICDLTKLINEISTLKKAGKKIIFTNGCFDILHVGHVIYLNHAKALGDILIIGLNTDDSVRRLKGDQRPVVTQIDRALIVDSLKSVDYVILFNEDTPFNLINNIKPDILVKGGDYQIENIVGADIVQKSGGVVKTIPFVEGKSTTELLSKIKIL
ncbi:MAG: D-glycero-beta-D-manno-heptose 1-phosphate adenylyltransferase [Ignavibacteria bacterium]|nr:D-glycero-beta-D-manno-heptose 1-phosphate adenylyltransferase [Ignavibacteria bacterium]